MLYEKRGFASKARGFEVSAVFPNTHTHTHTHTYTHTPEKQAAKLIHLNSTFRLVDLLLQDICSIRRVEDGANVQELDSNK